MQKVLANKHAELAYSPRSLLSIHDINVSSGEDASNL